ncbi:pyridoxal phosphate-dependent decarboxylase family protein, partial [Acidobacteriota bacterium]
MKKNKDPNPIYSGASPDKVGKDLKFLVDFQDQGLPLDALKKQIENKLIPHLMNYDRPEFQSLFNAFPEEGARLGARIALDYNQGVTNWQVSPGGAMLEELCCQALCRLFGLAPTSDATFMYCGTYANQQALFMALHCKAEKEGFDLSYDGLKGFYDPGNLSVLVSSDAHFSLRHGVRTLGLGDQSLIPIPVDKNRRMDVSILEKTIKNLKETRKIFCVAATAGTTSTGSVDPIKAIADVCTEHN